MDKLKVGIVSLGCDKNRIDSEIILGKFKDKYEIVNEPKIANIIIVNTCGFIESSKQESIDTILEMADYKKKHECDVLIVTGCLSQRYGNELMDLMPEIDILLGVNNYNKIIESVDEYLENKNKVTYIDDCDAVVNEGERVLSTGKHSAYIRISEGCNNYCTYCIIPKIRGKYRSRRMEDILNEAESLVRSGVKEIILVAQDTTQYGIDIYKQKKLHELLKSLSHIDGIKWIRVLYCYPEEITDELITEIANNPKVCKYIDMPLQHISDSVLKRMRRRGRKEQIVSIIKKMRASIEGLSLRTSIIVGFPGETEKDFEELKDFIKETKFEKLGVFKYSQEEDTEAAGYTDQIDEETKIKREEELMLLQQQISRKSNMEKLGKSYEILIEGFENDMWHGRSYEMSPEIDGAIFFKCDKILNIGDFITIKITEALEYDLIGVVCYESC